MAVTTELSLHDLVDLSLGTPEVVNYRGLRTLLLAIVDTLKLGEVKAEIKESEKKEILAEKKELIASQNAEARQNKLSRPSTSIGARTGSSEIMELEKKVSDLENKLDSLNQLPSNENLMERVKSGSLASSASQAPVSEMWQLMQVQKKAQSNEEGVSKLMSMVEHMMGEIQDVKKEADNMKQEMDRINKETSDLHDQVTSINNSNSSLVERLGGLEDSSKNQEKVNELHKVMDGITTTLGSLPPVELLVTWPAMEDALKGVQHEPAEVTTHWMQTSPMTDTTPVQAVPTSHAYVQTMTPSPQPSPSRPLSGGHPSHEIQRILKDIGELNGKHTHLEDRVNCLEDSLSKKADQSYVEQMVSENAIPEDLSNMIGELRESKDKLSSLQDLLDGDSRVSPVSRNDLDELKHSLQNQLKEIRDRLKNISHGDCEPLSLSVQSDLENQVQQDLTRLSNQIASQFSSQFKDTNARIGSLETFLDTKLSQIGKKLQKIKKFLEDDLQSRIMATSSSTPAEVERIVFERDTPSPSYDSELMDSITSKITNLQAEADKLNQTCVHMLDEHSAKQKHIDALYDFIDKLQANKADKEHVTMEIDVKADKQALENKISRNQFEGTVDEISRNLNSVMEQLSGHQSAWQQAVGEIKSDVDSKLDRLELDPLKAYLEKKIKAVNAKVIRKEPEVGEDAAGFRKQLLQKFHCISCDRPLDMTPQAPLASLPESKGLPGTRSGRPYTTFELEQIRAAQKRGLPGKNVNHYERALLEQEAARQRKQDIVAYLVHFERTRKDLPLVRNCMSMGLPCLPINRHMTFSNHYQEVPDYFVTNRSCGGSHTLTYPHRRVARITHLQHMGQPDDLPSTVMNGKIETDVVGQDGHIYKARVSPTQLDHLPNLAKPKVQSARARSRLGSARVRSQTAPSMTDERQSSRPSSSRQPSRPPSSRPVRPQSGRHSRSPPVTTQAAGDGRPPTPLQNGSHEDSGAMSMTTPAPSSVDEIAVELPGSEVQEQAQLPT